MTPLVAAVLGNLYGPPAAGNAWLGVAGEEGDAMASLDREHPEPSAVNRRRPPTGPLERGGKVSPAAPDPPSDGAARLVVDRQKSWMGAAVSWTVRVDDQPAGRVGNGRSVTVPTSPGRHRVVVGVDNVLLGMPSHALEIDVGAGETVALVARASAWRPTLAFAPGSGGRTAVAQRVNPPPPAAVVPVQYSVVESSRQETPLGEERRTIDNSQSSSESTRTVRLTREWSRSCTVEMERATTLSGSADLSIHVLDLKGGAEHTLSKTYSASADERETFEEEVTLNISAHTRTEVVFAWKEIRQRGFVRAAGSGYEIQIPYEVVVGVTFDQRQVDG